MHNLIICRFRKTEEKPEYITAMKQLFPVFYNIMIAILPNQSEPSVCLQRWILKIFYCTIHVSMQLVAVVAAGSSSSSGSRAFGSAL